MPGDEWELKVGPGRVQWDDGVEERDEGGQWRWDDRGPNGITKRPERLGTRGRDSGWGTCVSMSFLLHHPPVVPRIGQESLMWKY